MRYILVISVKVHLIGNIDLYEYEFLNGLLYYEWNALITFEAPFYEVWYFMCAWVLGHVNTQHPYPICYTCVNKCLETSWSFIVLKVQWRGTGDPPHVPYWGKFCVRPSGVIEWVWASLILGFVWNIRIGKGKKGKFQNFPLPCLVWEGK